MDAKIENIAIKGITAYVPEHVEDNYDFGALLGERRVKKQVKLTGVRKRHTSLLYQRTSDLCILAVQQLLDELSWERDSIGVLIFATQAADYVIPSTAIALQDRLGFSKNCIAFDMNLGCSGFNYGVQTAASILQTANSTKRAICLVGDEVQALAAKKELDKETISFSMLSGSAGTAIALEKENGALNLFDGTCDGEKYDAIIKRGYKCDTVMQGNEVFDYAINEVSDNIITFKKKNDLQEDDIDFYVFHQAQKLIIDSISDTCSLPTNKVLTSYEEYGNTSGASVPLTLCANADILRKKEKVKLLLCGFGVGLSCGITYLEMDTEHICPISESDWHYDEDKKPLNSLRNKAVILLNADTEMGRFIATELDYHGANVILCGKDEKELDDIKSNLFWRSYIVGFQSEDELIQKLCELREVEVDGIVGNPTSYFINECIEKNIFSEKISFVCIKSNDAVIGDLDKMNSELHKKYPKGRINVLEYESDSFDFVHVDAKHSWAEEYVKNGLPANMNRPNYLINSLVWLLGKKSDFVSGSVIKVDKTIS